MKVAVTGASGFIGQHVVQTLLGRGHSVSLLSRGYSENENNANDQIFRVKGSLSDKKAIKDLLKNVTVVCNCAGEFKSSEYMNEVNFIGVKNLYNEALNANVDKFIQLSSVGVYGFDVQGHVDENHVYKAENDYEESKILADKWLLAQDSNIIDVNILRPSIVFGENMKNNSLRQFVRAIASKRFFFIGKPGSSANYIYVQNVADAIAMLAESKIDSAKKVFNLSDHLTIEEFVDIIRVHFNIKTSFFRMPYGFIYIIAYLLDMLHLMFGLNFPLTRARVLALTSTSIYDTSLLKQTFNYELPVDLKTGLKKTLVAWD